jgi:hypothetical protein
MKAPRGCHFIVRRGGDGTADEPQSTTTMKTMMDLLICLRRREAAAAAATRHRHFSPGERLAARRHVDLVREVIPSEVLAQYDELKTTATDLDESPELLAMAALLTTYRSLPPAKRKKLLKHFAVTSRIQSSREKPSNRRSPGQVRRCHSITAHRGLAVAN